MARIITNENGFPLDYSCSFVSIRGKNSFMRLSYKPRRTLSFTPNFFSCFPDTPKPSGFVSKHSPAKVRQVF